MRLINADELIAVFNSRSTINVVGDGLCKAIIAQIEAMPTVEPTLYGYKIEHLALIARVMEKDDVTPEKAVEIFKDVQTIALKVIDEISGAVERAFEQAIETRGGGDDTAD